MANEFTLSGTLQFQNAEMSEGIVAQVVDLLASISADGRYISGIVSVGTSEEAIPLGEVSSPGWFFAKNLDPTNYVEVLTGTGGPAFARLRPATVSQPGHFCLLPLGTGVTAPFWVANTGACRVQYWLFDN